LLLQQRRALEEAQARAAALASELAGMRREIETQAEQSQKALDEAIKEKKQAVEAANAELRQSFKHRLADMDGAPRTYKGGWAGERGEGRR